MHSSLSGSSIFISFFFPVFAHRINSGELPNDLVALFFECLALFPGQCLWKDIPNMCFWSHFGFSLQLVLDSIQIPLLKLHVLAVQPISKTCQDANWE